MSQVINLGNNGTPAPGTVLFLQGDSGGQVGPDGTGTINVIADNAANNAGSSVLLVGTPINNTLTLNVTDVNNNTFIGKLSAHAGITGTANINVGGLGAFQALTTGRNNVYLGGSGFLALTTGIGNIGIGNGVAANLITGARNILIGFGNGANYTTNESDNIILGNNIPAVVGESRTTRIGIGNGSQSALATYVGGIYGVTPGGTLNMAIIDNNGQLGSQALPASGVLTLTGDTGGPVSPTAGNINILSNLLTNLAGATVFFDGSGSTLNFNTSDSVLANTFIGASSGNTTTTGANNTGVGVNSLFSLTTGSFNTAVGTSAGQQNAVGSNNTYVGFAAGSVTTSGDNTAIGSEAGRLTVGGSFNTSLGSGALRNNISGSQSVAIGYQTLFNATNTGNTAVGTQAGTSITTGAANTILGYQAGFNLSTGNTNIFIGNLAGQNITTSGNNICIGSGGVLGDSGVIRLGATGIHNSAYIKGIYGVTPGGTLNMAIIDNNGQLGSAALSPSSLFTWSVITADQTAAVNNGYFANKAGTLALALPAASAVGDVIEVTNENTALGVQFTQAAGQQILLPNNTSTTLGATGTLTSSAIGDSMKLVCKTANTIWRCVSMNGNWTPA